MRILVLIDVSNLYYCVHKRFRGARLNYISLLEFIAHKGPIVRAIAYGSHMNGQADKFIAFLNGLGVETRYKEPQVYHNPDGENRKADWDVGIAMDAVRMIDMYDTLVLVSADGDLCELVKWVHEKGRRSVVIGSGINWKLKELAGEAVEISPSLIPSIFENDYELMADRSEKSKQESVGFLNENRGDDLSESASESISTGS